MTKRKRRIEKIPKRRFGYGDVAQRLKAAWIYLDQRPSQIDPIVAGNMINRLITYLESTRKILFK